MSLSPTGGRVGGGEYLPTYSDSPGGWHDCETGPSVPSLTPWENVSFGIRPSVLFEMFLVWPCLAGLRWEKSNPSFLLSSRLRNELARFLPQFVSLSTCSIFSLLPLSWS